MTYFITSYCSLRILRRLLILPHFTPLNPVDSAISIIYHLISSILHHTNVLTTLKEQECNDSEQTYGHAGAWPSTRSGEKHELPSRIPLITPTKNYTHPTTSNPSLNTYQSWHLPTLPFLQPHSFMHVTPCIHVFLPPIFSLPPLCPLWSLFYSLPLVLLFSPSSLYSPHSPTLSSPHPPLFDFPPLFLLPPHYPSLAHFTLLFLRSLAPTRMIYWWQKGLPDCGNKLQWGSWNSLTICPKDYRFVPC